SSLIRKYVANPPIDSPSIVKLPQFSEIICTLIVIWRWYNSVPSFFYVFGCHLGCHNKIIY
ncbi:MAG: hypothetical protein NZ961_25220, partial [Candidatus Poribacteria bacterium]|nr:hypothetical protein [Candidatus Poribacteria bacterium]